MSLRAQNVANVLCERRRSLHVSRTDIAQVLGTSVDYIRRRESGETPLSLADAATIAEQLGLELRVELVPAGGA